MNTKPMEGIKVVDFTLAAAGPMCSKLLAEYGAECWLVEPVKGVSNRPAIHFGYMNANKKSIPLDLKTADGMKIMHELLAQADVFVSNYRTKALVKMGLDYETLHSKYPRLIYASLTGYGEAGPMKDDPGFDTTAFWGLAGLMHDTQEKDAPPLVPLSGMGDCLTGAFLAGGIATALFQRTRTGEGMKVSTSLLQAGLYCNFSQMYFNQYGVTYPKSRLTPNRSMLNTYPCKDGYFLLTTLNFDKDFWNLMRVIGREDLVGDPRWTCMKDTEGENALELRKILDEAFSKMTLAEAKAKLQSVDMAFGEIIGSKEAMVHPQVVENKYVFQCANMDGKEVTLPVSPVRFNNETTPECNIGPVLGEHTVEILTSLGYTPEQIQDLLDKKVTVTAGA